MSLCYPPRTPVYGVLHSLIAANQRPRDGLLSQMSTILPQTTNRGIKADTPTPHPPHVNEASITLMPADHFPSVLF